MATTIQRRTFIAGLSATALVLTLPGCANPANRAAPTATPTGTGFPVHVEHRYGTTTVPAPPQRIVALGQTDLDPVAALGAVPIAVGSFIGSSYSPLRPWNSDRLPAEPTLLNMQEICFGRPNTPTSTTGSYLDRGERREVRAWVSPKVERLG